MRWLDVIRYLSFLGKETAWKAWRAFPEVTQILSLNYGGPEKSQHKTSKGLNILTSSCMKEPIRTKVLTNAASIYLHRWTAQWITAHLHEMPCWNTFPWACHSQTYGRVEASEELKKCFCKGLLSGTVAYAKNTTFHVQIYAAVKDNVKTRLIYGLCLMTSAV